LFITIIFNITILSMCHSTRNLWQLPFNNAYFFFLAWNSSFLFFYFVLVIKELSEAWKSFPSLRRLVLNVDFYEDSTIHNSRNKGKIKFVTSNSLHHDSILTAGSNFKLKSSLPRSITSHLVTCTSMQHGNSPHAHSISDVDHTLGQVRANFFAKILH